MKKIKFKKSITMAAAICGFLCLTIGFLLYPQKIREEIYQKLTYCFTLLVPTLFPFIALTSYGVNSRISVFFSKTLGFVTKYVFRLPKCCTITIVMSLIGGYPSGASGISIMLKKGIITRAQAARMLLFCVNPGIAFVISFLGGVILESTVTGIHLFLAIIISSLLIGAFTALWDKIPNDTIENNSEPKGGALIAAAHDASESMIKMLGCIMLFTSIFTLINASGLTELICRNIALFTHIDAETIKGIFLLSMEITTGVGEVAKGQISAAVYAFALAFGGICVHLQIFSFFTFFPLQKLKFIFTRLCHGFLSAVVYMALRPLFRQSQEVISSINASGFFNGGFNMSAAGGISLTLMCIAFLIISSSRKEKETLQR